MSDYKLLIMDVDGTLTEGKIYIGRDGEIMKAFDVKDGYGIACILPKVGIKPVIITGRESKIVEQRAKELKILELHQGVADKLSKLKYVAEKYNITFDKIAYIGDDVNDLECMQWCGLSACPADAVQEVLEQADYVCKAQGGRGAVREFIDWLTKH